MDYDSDEFVLYDEVVQLSSESSDDSLHELGTYFEQIKSLEYATTEGFEACETDLKLLNDRQNELEVNNARLEKLVAELGKKKPMFNVVVGSLCMVVVGLAILLMMK